MQRTRPDLFMNHRFKSAPSVLRAIGELVPGQIAQVAVKDTVQRTNLCTAIRSAFPHTNFMMEGFQTGGKHYLYIYIEKSKRQAI